MTFTLTNIGRTTACANWASAHANGPCINVFIFQEHIVVVNVCNKTNKIQKQKRKKSSDKLIIRY